MRVLRLNYASAVKAALGIAKPLGAPELINLSKQVFGKEIDLAAAAELMQQMRTNRSLSLVAFTLRFFAVGGIREGSVSDLASYCHGIGLA